MSIPLELPHSTDSAADGWYNLATPGEGVGPAMIHSIKIKGYRTFSNFSMDGLGRINLLVGKNNSGKSSVLEALSLLWGGANLNALWQILTRRGEQPIIDVTAGRLIQPEVDVSHMFAGHQARIGGEFSIRTTNETPDRAVTYQITEARPEENPALFNMITAQEPIGASMSLRLLGTGVNIQPIPLTQRGSLRSDVFNQALNAARATLPQIDIAQYITTESLNMPQLHQLWNDIALKPEEDRVVSALRFIDPAIDRIGPVTGQPYFGGIGSMRGGFVIRRKGEDRIPIGSFGDGIWRMFALAAVLSRTKGGLVLVDEIDTGLHHVVMEQMWRFVNDVSKEFKTQVFATTHSYDCVNALASICSEYDGADEVSIQRIETGGETAIRFSEAEIKIAAKRHIEMR
jgi:AAA domain, putative AbiEii toxin, Type IV TA system/AAA ATPase domain